MVDFRGGLEELGALFQDGAQLHFLGSLLLECVEVGRDLQKMLLVRGQGFVEIVETPGICRVVVVVDGVVQVNEPEGVGGRNVR